MVLIMSAASPPVAQTTYSGRLGHLKRCQFRPLLANFSRSYFFPERQGIVLRLTLDAFHP